jgi:uncharacterized NAD(P)/FAD-binding protein YdhS
VGVVGGGFSGTLLAIHLLRGGAEVTLIERAPRVARGVAYSTPHADHLLNVRASGMSAFPDDPSHFVRWLEDRSEAGPDSFAQRRLYGTYLEELLEAAAAKDRLRRIHGEAVAIARGETGELIRLADGEVVACEAAVLAVGNLPPGASGIYAGMPDHIYVADPWSGNLAEGLEEGDTVLLIGTGLTAIDAALILDSARFAGPILALSRRGLVPRAHAAPAKVEALDAPPPPRASALLRSVREAAARIGWRSAVDQLRPVTQSLWASAPIAERLRFLRHLRPWWDVHRHRIAPQIAERIERMERAGQLTFGAGKIVSCNLDGNQAQVAWRPRGSEEVAELRVRRIVNCTGPEANVARADEALLRNLVGSDRLRADPCRIGIDIDAESRVVDAKGLASPTLFCVGPMTRGAWWEIVAVPDIRSQVAALAHRLLAA